MPRRTAYRFGFQGGFYPTQAKTLGIPGTIISGQNVWCWGTLLESAKGTASAGSSGAPNPLMNVAATHGGVTGGGSVYDAFGVTWAAGSSGTAYKGGSSLGTVSGSLRLKAGAAAILDAGVAAPSAPTIAPSPDASTKINGSYSVVLTGIRVATGHESSRSLPSAAVAINGFKIRITVPAVPTGLSAGAGDKWGIYASYKGFGTTGPWFHHSDVVIGSATYDIEYYNQELGLQAPIDHDVPPTCTHAFAINNVNVAAGAYTGGSGLSPSIPGVPEGFPPDFTLFLPGGGAITSCKGTGFAGTALISTATSLYEVIATNNADVSPILIRQLWPTVGFGTGSAWCTVEDEVYGFSGQRGAVRSRGADSPDTSFSIPVQKYFADNGFTTANTVVGHDPKTNTILFCSGSVALPFDRAREIWHTPMTFSGTATTGATVGGQFLLDVGAGALVSFESGGGTTWNVVPAFTDFDLPEFNHTIVRARTSNNATVTLDVLANEDTSTSQAGPFSQVAPHGAWQHINVRDAKTASVKVSGTGSANSIYEILLEAIAHRHTR